MNAFYSLSDVIFLHFAAQSQAAHKLVGKKAEMN